MIKPLGIEIKKRTENEIVFDMIGYDVSFANAIRRILLAEVPTMAIEKVELYNNTTVMHDEFLGHRLGLIPIKVDPNFFDFLYAEDEQETEKNTVRFGLYVTNPLTSKENMMIYSRELKWKPIGDQKTTFELEPIKPVDDDILIAKLAPSQKIEADLVVRKGTGKDHAKYSPVSGCFYRHLTTFHLNSEYTLDLNEIEKLKTCFPKGHFRFMGDIIPETGEQVLEPIIVVNDRLDNSSDLTFESCPSLKKKIIINTSDDILTFTVESIGIIESSELVLRGIDLLRTKCNRFQKIVSKYKKM